MKKLLTLTAVGAVMLATTQANAAGFLIREQSVSGMGNAFAGGTAAAEDISYSFWNPAGLTRHEGTNINGNLTLLYSTIDATNEVSGAKSDDIIPFSPIPSMYLSHQVDDKITVGFSVTAPFGLVTDYDDNLSLFGGSQDTLSDLRTINMAQTIAYKATDKLSLGVGLNVEYIEAKLQTAFAGGVFPSQNLKGNDVALGYTLGALYEFTDKTRVGVGYRSEIEHTLKGDGYAGPLVGYNGEMHADLTTPDLLSFGVYHELNNKWAVMAEAQRTGWSSFQRLDIIMDEGAGAGTPLGGGTNENWDDVWFYSIGANYKVSDTLKLRFGLAYDNNPVESEYRTMRIPDSDRIWYSVGAEYKYDEKITLNAGYTFISADSTTALSHQTAGDEISYKGNIHLLGLGFNYNF